VVVPEAELDERALEIARRMAAGPTLAHAATKSIVHAAVEHGTRAADTIVPEVSGALFASADLRNAVRSFLDEGPGKASYEGR
jgi:enoyl-CoA hydratase/carnithine racemase